MVFIHYDSAMRITPPIFKLFVCVGLGIMVLLLGCDRGEGQSITEEKDLRVILAGHLYSLYTSDRSEAKGPGILTSKWIELFAQEVDESHSDALFLLGDTTRFSTEEEWQLVNKAFEGMKTPAYRIAGNHDYRNVDAFRQHGGLGNSALVIKGCKFILLDNKCVLEKDDLEFLDRELRDAKSFRQVFVLTHYNMINWNESQPGQDPHESYPGVSNWNKDVVPKLAGVVDYVICGDHTPGGPKRFEQEYEGKKIHYIMTSFVFRRGETEQSNGEGINVYLELTVNDEGVHILPRALAIPLTDSWYRDFNVTESWKVHGVDGAWVWAPESWVFKKGATPQSFEFADPALPLTLLVNRTQLPPGMTWEVWLRNRGTVLLSAHPRTQSISGGDLKIWHHPARWEVLRLDPQDPISGRFYCSFVHKGEVWTFEGHGPSDFSQGGKDGSWTGQMLRFVAGIKIR